MNLEDPVKRPEKRKVSQREEIVDRLIRENFIAMLKKGRSKKFR